MNWEEIYLNGGEKNLAHFNLRILLKRLSVIDADWRPNKWR